MEREGPVLEESTLAGDEATMLGTLSASDPALHGGLRRLLAGAQVGRYVVLEEVGRGAMGVVYTAYDPRLDRRVALKILTTARAGAGASERLQREAQALARLSHPNVVVVHDVGEFGDSLFIAMEFVEGETLAEWLDAATPSVAEILAVFLAAGEGLDAAHQAKLVHRDFKPENVMVGCDGRVRVMDFGVAHAGEREHPVLLEFSGDSQATQHGTMIGTPSYMAPEQFNGELVDARADQFSFCVALYRALYGQAPFPGESVAALALNVTTGKLREPPPRSDIDARVRRALMRGLASDPDARWPDMRALLEAMQARPPAPSRWPLALAASAGLGLLTLGALSLERERDAQPALCTGAEAVLAPTWSPARHTALRERVLAIELPFATHAWAHIEGELETWSQAWVAAHTEACAATQLRGEQSEALLDLRMRCLDRKRDALEATIFVLETADATNLAELVELVDDLPLLARCEDLDALRALVPLPEDPRAREQIAALEREIESLRALHRGGQFEQVRARLPPLHERIATLDYAPLRMSAAELEANLATIEVDHARAHAAQERAFRAAVLAHDDYHAATYAIALTRSTGYELRDPKVGETWAKIADALTQRVGRPPELESRRLAQEGVLAIALDERARAIVKFERALQLRETITEQPHDVPLALLRTNLGASLLSAGEALRAAELHRQAIATYRATYGSQHPLIATLLLNYSNALQALGRIEDALSEVEAALAIRVRVFGPDHPETLDVRNNLAVLLDEVGDFERALAEHQTLLDIRRATEQPGSKRIVQSWVNLGAAHERLGHNAEARACYAEALELRVAAGGRQQARVADVLYNVGQSYMSEDRFEDARASFSEALSIYRAVHPPTHPDIGWGATGLGRALVGLGRMREAEPVLREALALRDKPGVHPGLRAETRFALAQAIIQRERSAAEQLARGALSDYEALGVAAKGLEREHNELLEWVAAQGWSR